MSIHTEDFGDDFAAAPQRKPRAKPQPKVVAQDNHGGAETPMRSSTISPAPVNKHEEVMERALRPKLLDEYVGRKKRASSSKSSSARPKNAVSRWTTYCCLARPVWARPRSPTSLRLNWA